MMGDGITLRDWLAGQALASGGLKQDFAASDYQIKRWFGGRGGITSAEILAAQAYEIADAFLARRAVGLEEH